MFGVPLPARNGAFDHFETFTFLNIVDFKIFFYLFDYGVCFFADYIFELNFLVNAFLAVLGRVIRLQGLQDLCNHIFGPARLHEGLLMPE